MASKGAIKIKKELFRKIFDRKTTIFRLLCLQNFTLGQNQNFLRELKKAYMIRHTYLKQHLRRSAGVLFCAAALSACQGSKWTIEHHTTYDLIRQQGGQTLGYAPQSGLTILHADGYAFKDLNRNGQLDPYEDWRNAPQERAEALAAELSMDEIAGLMLYSTHQAVPTDSAGFWSSTYNGTSLRESGLPESALSDKQKKFLAEDNLRAVLIVRAASPRIAAEWNNNLQAFVEGRNHGIPVNISSDPRNETKASAEYNAGSGGKISLWPCPLGLAATFNPALVEHFGRIASLEYRALGIATALSPQADLGTEPRWNRFYGTFGEDSDLATDLTRAYIDGFQSSDGEAEIAEGWGYESVNAMVKHWPGGGPEEGGRDAHYCFGKYTVYPSHNLQEQIKPFLEGAFALHGKTRTAAAVMPYYTISYGVDPSGRNVGNGFSKYLISDLLREKYTYNGVVCTDWGITHDYTKIEEADGKCWGVELLSEADRHYEAIKAGVDQFGGNNDKRPVIEAYNRWVAEFGEASARRRFERSAARLLLNSFRTGLFENPYVDPDQTEQIVGKQEFMKAGYEAQLQSIVLLKNNRHVLPQKERKKIFMPATSISIDSALIARYFDRTDNSAEADFALLFINEPQSGNGYKLEDRTRGGNGYIPISLQYNDYTATAARRVSLAGGDPKEPSTNRSYYGKTVRCSNRGDLTAVLNARDVMGNKPVIVAIAASKPFVPAEFEPAADAILVAFGVQHQAVLEMIAGYAEPSALLPMQLPANMESVEQQAEDRPRDMTCYRDRAGNLYDFAFGLNWNGVIRDQRVEKYR